MKFRVMIGGIFLAMEGNNSLERATCIKLRAIRYSRAYIDFFEDELVLNGYEWRKVVEKYLLSGKEPLINNLIAGREFS